jgi:hypothetical protein
MLLLVLRNARNDMCNVLLISQIQNLEGLGCHSQPAGLLEIGSFWVKWQMNTVAE